MIEPSRAPAPRPMRTWPFRAVVPLASALAALLAAALHVGCSASQSDSAPAGGPADFGDASAEADDATAANPMLDNAGSDASSTSAYGSRLCRSLASSPCFPDEIPTSSPSCMAASAPYVDGGADAGASGADAAADAAADPTIACHVVVSPEDAGLGGPACLPAGPRSAGAACLKSTDCASGYECVGNPGQCLHYCCSGSCADTQTFCDVEVAVGGATVPVCAAIRKCKLLAANACDPGYTCAIVDDNGTTSCVETGPAKAGQECDDIHCGEGLTCLGHTDDRHCYQLCHNTTASACPDGLTCKGYAPTFPDRDIGACQP